MVVCDMFVLFVLFFALPMIYSNCKQIWVTIWRISMFGKAGHFSQFNEHRNCYELPCMEMFSCMLHYKIPTLSSLLKKRIHHFSPSNVPPTAIVFHWSDHLIRVIDESFNTTKLERPLRFFKAVIICKNLISGQPFIIEIKISYST